MSPVGTILVIDDDPEIRYSLQRVLTAHGHTVLEAGSGEDGIKLLRTTSPDLAFLDNRMNGMTGIEALQHIRSQQPHLLVVLMTAFGTAQTAIEAMKFGAFDYVIKPFDVEKVLAVTEAALRARRELALTAPYKPLLDIDAHKEGLIGNSPPMQQVFKFIGQVTASDVTVLISGESGTGKELIARSIHRHSHRASRPYTAINCAAIPENLIESELFGHEKGAFTGAVAQRIGRFEQCDGGTIFLDEIGDMELTTQTKILRVLQEGEIQRVGGSETIHVDVRVIAATNKDLEKMVEDKTFREDLYYRLNVMRIRVPPLRERTSDLPQIVDFFLQRLAKERKTRARCISPDALALLLRHRWPGNVRELENVIYRAAVVAQGDAILPKDLPAEIVADATSPAAPTTAQPDGLLRQLHATAVQAGAPDPLEWVRAGWSRLGLLAAEPNAAPAETAPEPSRRRKR